MESQRSKAYLTSELVTNVGVEIHTWSAIPYVPGLRFEPRYGFRGYEDEDPSLRRAVLIDLYYGLSHWWWRLCLDGPFFGLQSPKDFHGQRMYDMSPSVALVGMHLPDFEASELWGDDRSPMRNSAPKLLRIANVVLHSSLTF